MTVPALDTSIIGTFAYLEPATSVQLSDVLSYFYTYIQYPEYVDGVWRVYDTGGSSGYYCDVYVRIRTDGWMMAFFPDDDHQATACWHGWTLGEYLNRGDLTWWGSAIVHGVTPTPPPTDSTRLSRALQEAWVLMAANSDNPTYSFVHGDVAYYDYEILSGNTIYLFGEVYEGTGFHYRYEHCLFTVPVGTTVFNAYANYGVYCSSYTIWFYMNSTCFYSTGGVTPGYYSQEITNYLQPAGAQNDTYIKGYGRYSGEGAMAIVVFADG